MATQVRFSQLGWLCVFIAANIMLNGVTGGCGVDHLYWRLMVNPRVNDTHQCLPVYYVGPNITQCSGSCNSPRAFSYYYSEASFYIHPIPMMTSHHEVHICDGTSSTASCDIVFLCMENYVVDLFPPYLENIVEYIMGIEIPSQCTELNLLCLNMALDATLDTLHLSRTLVTPMIMTDVPIPIFTSCNCISDSYPILAAP